MKKLFWIILIIITIFGISLFLAPNITNSIEKALWFSWFWDKIRNIWWGFGKTMSDIPNADELKKWYQDALSWATDLKHKVVNGIQTTKDTIDTVRATAWDAEDTYNKAKDVIKDTTDTIDKIKWTLNDVEKMQDSIKWAVDIWTF